MRKEKKLLAVVRCLKNDPRGKRAIFHFRGAFAGRMVRNIVVPLEHTDWENFFIYREDYLLLIENLGISEDGELLSRVLKATKLGGGGPPIALRDFLQEEESERITDRYAH